MCTQENVPFFWVLGKVGVGVTTQLVITQMSHGMRHARDWSHRQDNELCPTLPRNILLSPDHSLLDIAVCLFEDLFFNCYYMCGYMHIECRYLQRSERVSDSVGLELLSGSFELRGVGTEN